MSEKKKLCIVAGPTCTGKTASAISLAKRIQGEIISADSMQVYRGMDIGSAKVREEEKQGIPHHLIDVLDPTEAFNVATFKSLADRAMEEIYKNRHIPILVGGTGFYIQSVLYNIDFTEGNEDTAYKNELEEIYQKYGKEKLFQMLGEVDPESAKLIHENNVKRVMRALTFYHETGRRISEHNAEEREKESPFDFRFYVLHMDRALLYERINRRVDLMVEEGLVEEVIRLRDRGLTRKDVSMQGLGYKEILDYLDGRCTLPEAIEKIKLETRHFAKRQFTWFKREKDVIWVDVTKEDLIDVYENGPFN